MNENMKNIQDETNANQELKADELKKEELDKVAGGGLIYKPDDYYETVSDQTGQVIGTYNTLEEAKFHASGVCPRCGKTFADKSEIESHINAWASGKK